MSAHMYSIVPSARNGTKLENFERIIYNIYMLIHALDKFNVVLT